MARTRDEGRAEERRREVARATWQVIAEQGLERASLRSIARRGGFTTGVLTYYFRGKQEILLFAGRTVLRSLVARLERRIRGDESLPALAQALASELPTTAETVLGWRIWLAFTARVPSDPDFAREHEERYRDVRALLRRCLDAAGKAGALAPGIDRAEEADRIVATFDGIGLHALLEPERYPQARQKRLLAKAIRRIARGPSAAPERKHR